MQNAAARSSALNDQALRQIGADLHDGPAQLMSFAALRLGDLRPALAGPAAQADRVSVERAVKDAIRKIRSISRGLSLPDIESRPARAVVQGMAEAHAARSGHTVEVLCTLPVDRPLGPAIKICLYRFVQEGLNNALHHADGQGQQVDLSLTGDLLSLAVRDRGPGFRVPVAGDDGHVADDDGSGMGLAGLRGRIESLGGSFSVGPNPQPRALDAGMTGAEIKMQIDLKDAR